MIRVARAAARGLPGARRSARARAAAAGRRHRRAEVSGLPDARHSGISAVASGRAAAARGGVAATAGGRPPRRARAELRDLLKRDRRRSIRPKPGWASRALADREFKQAAAHFAARARDDDRYLPALARSGRCATGLGDDAAAIAALERWCSRSIRRGGRSRRGWSSCACGRCRPQIEPAARARDAGRLDEAQTDARARARARRRAAPCCCANWRASRSAAERVGPGGDPRAPGDSARSRRRRRRRRCSAPCSSGSGRVREAADAYARAVAIDPRPAWREQSGVCKSKAATAVDAAGVSRDSARPRP